jgi:NDP-sugar pyrophosphorylase family protein
VNTAIILAQGQGSKIWPFGATRPKAAIPIGGTALLRLQLDALEAAGFSRAVVVASPRGAAHLRHIAAGKGSQPAGASGMMRPAGKSSRLQVRVVALDQVLGTAPALQCGLQGLEDEHVLVLYGDVVLDPETLPRLLAAHAKDQDVVIALAAALQPLEDQSIYLAVRVKDGLVEEMMAHPRHNVTHRLAGAFVFRTAEVVPYLEAHPGYVAAVPSGGMPPQAEADLAQCLQMMVEDGLTARAVEPAEFALDVDRPWDILTASYTWLDYCGRRLDRDLVHPTARISERAEIGGHVAVGENATVGPGAVIEGAAWIEKDTLVTHGAILGRNVHIGPRCLVKDYAWVGEHTSIGPRCKLSHCAEVHGVAFGRSTIQHYCEVVGVLGLAVDVGAGTTSGTLRFDDQPQGQRVKGRWDTPRRASEASFIGDFCRTGVSSMLMPGCKVGAYSAIGPGVVVEGDVPERSLLVLKQQVERKEWGPEKYGW